IGCMVAAWSVNSCYKSTVAAGRAEEGELMRRAFALVAVLAAMTGPAIGPATSGDLDPALTSAFGGWGISAPTSGSLIFCHGYGCNFRTLIGISGADHARLVAL